MIKEYERELTESEKRILKREMDDVKASIPKSIMSIILKILLVIVFIAIVIYFPKIWLIFIFGIISFFLIWTITIDLPDLINIPKFLKEKEAVINNGITRVSEINIDRYIKIANFEDEGNHFIVEYNGKLTLIGGQDFLGVRKLKNKIEQIEIMNSEKNRIYYEKVKKYGKNLSPYYVFKKGISDKFVESEIWTNLTNRNPFSGKLEDLNEFIKEDKSR